MIIVRQKVKTNLKTCLVVFKCIIICMRSKLVRKFMCLNMKVVNLQSKLLFNVKMGQNCKTIERPIKARLITLKIS